MSSEKKRAPTAAQRGSNSQPPRRDKQNESPTLGDGRRDEEVLPLRQPGHGAVKRAPTARELKAIADAKALRAALPKRAAVEIVEGDGPVMQVTAPHNDQTGWADHLVSTFGTTSDEFANQSFTRLGNLLASKGKRPTAEQMNGALALMGAIGPQNELETALGEQIIAAHAASLEFLARARLNAGEHVDVAAAYAGMATKATRSIAVLVDTLAKLRGGGRQRIEVIYVNGPAVIGDRAQALIAGEGGEASEPFRGQSHAPQIIAGVAAAESLPLPGQDT